MKVNESQQSSSEIDNESKEFSLEIEELEDRVAPTLGAFPLERLYMDEVA